MKNKSPSPLKFNGKLRKNDLSPIHKKIMFRKLQRNLISQENWNKVAESSYTFDQPIVEKPEYGIGIRSNKAKQIYIKEDQEICEKNQNKGKFNYRLGKGASKKNNFKIRAEKTASTLLRRTGGNLSLIKSFENRYNSVKRYNKKIEKKTENLELYNSLSVAKTGRNGTNYETFNNPIEYKNLSKRVFNFFKDPHDNLNDNNNRNSELNSIEKKLNSYLQSKKINLPKIQNPNNFNLIQKSTSQYHSNGKKPLLYFEGSNIKLLHKIKEAKNEQNSFIFMTSFTQKNGKSTGSNFKPKFPIKRSYHSNNFNDEESVEKSELEIPEKIEKYNLNKVSLHSGVKNAIEGQLKNGLILDENTKKIKENRLENYKKISEKKSRMKKRKESDELYKKIMKKKFENHSEEDTKRLMRNRDLDDADFETEINSREIEDKVVFIKRIMSAGNKEESEIQESYLDKKMNEFLKKVTD